jgi:hypothetical protein
VNAPAVMRPGRDAPAARPALSGPLESGKFPERLRARVVTPGERPCLHGYDVESDLARYYQPVDLTFLALTGELPTPEAAAALGVVMAFLAPVSVAQASAHAAVLSRLCGAPTRSSVGVAAIGLAEQAHVEVATHGPFLAWLAASHVPIPPEFTAQSPADDAALERLRGALAERELSLPVLDLPLSRAAALFAVLVHAGVRRTDQLEALLVLARLPAVIAEALAETPANFGNYPINLPAFAYEEPA